MDSETGLRRGRERLAACRLIAAVVAVLAIGAIALASCAANGLSQSPAQTSGAGPPASVDWLVAPAGDPPLDFPEGVTWQVHFTNPEYSRRTQIGRGGLDERLAALIDTARQTLDVAIYQLDLASVTQAAINAQRRGVRVRVVTDIDTLSDLAENRSFRQLEAAGIPIVAGNANAIMHNKFVIVDGTTLWTGSWNFTANDTYRNNNNALVVSSSHLAENYTQTFEKMFTRGQFGSGRVAGGGIPRFILDGTLVESYFTPEDDVAGERIVAYLRSARTSIAFMVFSLTAGGIAQALGEAMQRGVTVRGVFERGNASSLFSQYPSLKALGMDVLLDGNPDQMHHKVFIVDDRVVMTGSYNYSSSAEHANDENVLIVDDARLAQAYASEFRRVWQQAQKARQ